MGATCANLGPLTPPSPGPLQVLESLTPIPDLRFDSGMFSCRRERGRMDRRPDL